MRGYYGWQNDFFDPEPDEHFTMLDVIANGGDWSDSEDPFDGVARDMTQDWIEWIKSKDEIAFEDESFRFENYHGGKIL